MTPHLRVVEAGDSEDLVERMRTVLEEWRTFQLMDVYDGGDQLVLRMAPEGAPTFS